MDMLFDVTLEEDEHCRIRLEYDRSATHFKLVAAAWGSPPYDLWGAALQSNVLGDGPTTKASFVNALIREYPEAVASWPRPRICPAPLLADSEEIWKGTIATADALFP